MLSEGTSRTGSLPVRVDEDDDGWNSGGWNSGGWNSGGEPGGYNNKFVAVILRESELLASSDLGKEKLSFSAAVLFDDVDDEPKVNLVCPFSHEGRPAWNLSK